MDTLLMADIAGYANYIHTTQNLQALKAGLRECVAQACLEARIPLEECDIQDMGGDSLLILARETVDRGLFAGDFLPALEAELVRHNSLRPPEEQIELRLALHVGKVIRTEDGPFGPCIHHVRRLLDSKPLRRLLRKSKGPLATMVSDPFYHEVVRQSSNYGPDEYRQVRVREKETRCVGWVRLPGQELRSVPFLTMAEFLETAKRFGQRLGL